MRAHGRTFKHGGGGAPVQPHLQLLGAYSADSRTSGHGGDCSAGCLQRRQTHRAENWRPASNCRRTLVYSGHCTPGSALSP
ncbi:hypothetical protein GDO78_012140 [Eleutherodactylus coqui]|uniref:Uncharacterized protein n=1 Tax=Eleutherodactylus coqui TaxID=57060 RepID=A0A8J6K6K3_ELECQ|nr:hypothetical protein GDO78_012140 [Eleutherodactylus coqui]